MKLKKISVGDTVSNWIHVVNSIIDVLTLSKSSTIDEYGNLSGGVDGLISKEDKLKIDTLEDTYIFKNKNSGVISLSSSSVIYEDSILNLTIDSSDSIVYNTSGECVINIFECNDKKSFSSKYILLNAIDNTKLLINGAVNSIEFGKKGEKKLLNVVFINGEVFIGIF